MTDAATSHLIRQENAARIADVMACINGHTYRHRLQDRQIKDPHIKDGECLEIRDLTYQTLMNPKTQVIKIKEPSGAINYKFYNPETNWIVIIDQTAKDWGTAFHPDNKDRAKKLMKDHGVPILENGQVGFVERMKLGFFSNQSRHEEIETGRYRHGVPHDAKPITYASPDFASSSIPDTQQDTFTALVGQFKTQAEAKSSKGSTTLAHSAGQVSHNFAPA